MRKVNLDVMRPWIANKVIELVGFEDEVVVEYAMGLLEDPAQPVSNKIATIVLNNVDVWTSFNIRHQILERCR